MVAVFHTCYTLFFCLFSATSTRVSNHGQSQYTVLFLCQIIFPCCTQENVAYFRIDCHAIGIQTLCSLHGKNPLVLRTEVCPRTNVFHTLYSILFVHPQHYVLQHLIRQTLPFHNMLFVYKCDFKCKPVSFLISCSNYVKCRRNEPEANCVWCMVTDPPKIPE